MNIVLDTNVLIMSLSRKSKYYTIWKGLQDGLFTICYSNEILEEYEEIITNKMNSKIAEHVITALLNFPNSKKVEVYFHFNLITSDIDDNKFVDCAIKANAQFIVTQDHHYDILNSIDFPRVNIIDIDNFSLLLHNSIT